MPFMKQRSLLVFLSLATLCAGQGNPADEIPDFDLEDYYVEPKMTLHVGVRALTGSKTAFGGQGFVSSHTQLQDTTSTDVVRRYHDGVVFVDSRTGATDGKTNNWAYDDGRQQVNNGADLEFHTYSAQVTDSTIRRNEQGVSLGSELVLSRDIAKIGDKLEVKLTAGVGINGIQASARDDVMVDYTTITDTYSLDGQTLPLPVSGPYQAPTYETNHFDGERVETSVLLDRRPDSRTSTTVADGTVLSNYWKLRGTYLTVRLGPTIIYSITDKLRLTVSGGPALVHSGSTYSVQHTFTVDTSSVISDTVKSSEGHNLTGYYADASLEYLLSENAGLYLGTFYQTAGEYVQSITENGSNYTVDVDLSRLQGFRGGLNFKF